MLCFVGTFSLLLVPVFSLSLSPEGSRVLLHKGNPSVHHPSVAARKYPPTVEGRKYCHNLQKQGQQGPSVTIEGGSHSFQLQAKLWQRSCSIDLPVLFLKIYCQNLKVV